MAISGDPGQRLGPARLPGLVPWPQPRTHLGKGCLICFHLPDSSPTLLASTLFNALFFQGAVLSLIFTLGLSMALSKKKQSKAVEVE